MSDLERKPVELDATDSTPEGWGGSASMMITVVPISESWQTPGQVPADTKFVARITTDVRQMTTARSPEYGWTSTVRFGRWTEGLGPTPQEAIQYALKHHSERTDL